MEDGPRCQRDLVATLAALMAPLVRQLIGFCMPASRTREPIRPPTSCQISLAGFLRGKVGLKLAEGLWE